MEKNEIYIGEVVSIGSNGEGIIKNEDITVFVPFAIKDEKIKYQILKVRKNIAFGKLIEVIKSSKDRVIPPCPYFYKCGGCHIQHINYNTQLLLKKNIVKTCFSKVAGIEFDVDDTVACEHKFAYRNKLQLPVRDVGGKNVIGFFAENSHRIVEIDNCLINPSWTKQLIIAVKEYLSTFNLKGYDENKNSGDIREVTAKQVGDSLIITIVGLNKNLPFSKEIVGIFKKYLEFNFSLYYNYNVVASNVIYGDCFSLIYGNANYFQEMNDIKYTVGVRSFMQVNNYVCNKLYNTVLNNIDSTSTVIDAYSGAGLMTAMFALKTGRAYGIEIIPEAVDNANNLAIQNNLQDKMTNYLGKCEEILPKILNNFDIDNTTLVLDPPRKGCDIKVIESIISCKIKKILYISCMPSTLSRDVGLLTGSLIYKDGEIKRNLEKNRQYKIEFIRPFDMFPQTKHIETLVLLTKE